MRADLAGDPRDVLRELFVAPSPTAHAWTDPALVLSRLADEFGLTVPSPLPQDADGKVNGHVLADDFALQLALTEAWDAFGRPDDFPYRGRLPHIADQRARQVTFVRNEIMPHARLGPLMQARMEQIEPSYPLAAWAAGKTGEPAALPVLARQRWQAALTSFESAAAAGLRAAHPGSTAHEASISGGAAGPWDDAKIAHWSILANLANLCARVAGSSPSG